MSQKPTYEELEQRVQALQEKNAELEASKQKYRQLAENLNDVIYTVNEKGVINYVSSNIKNISGYSPEEMIGRHFTDFVHPEDRDECFGNFKEMISGEENTSEYRYYTKNRGYVWGFTRHKLIIDGGKITGVQGVMVDITLRKQMEEDLRESQRKIQRLTETIPEVFWLTAVGDYEKIEYVSPAFKEIWGERPEELYKNPRLWVDRIHPEERDRVLNSFHKLINEKEPFDEEFRIVRSDGLVRWIHDQGYLLDEGDGMYRLAGIAQDVTERKQSEDALRESEERFSIAFKSSPAPLVISEIDTGLFLDVNDRWLEMLGYAREEMIGRTSKDVGIWHEPDERDRIVKKLRTDGRFRDQPIAFRTKSGSIIRALWSGEALNISGQEVMLSMITDITELKRAEEERERLQEQLSHAQKMESIGRLAGGVAHDLNNLLSPILGYGEMLLEDATPNDPRKGFISEIVSAGKRAQSLVRQLLAFSRKQPLQFQSLDINELIKNFKKLLRRTLREDIEIQIHFGALIPPVEGDAGQLEQVVMNIAVNAQDAMPLGGRLTIETTSLELDEECVKGENSLSAGSYVMVAMSDTGIGMDAETLKYLFEPFFTTKEKGKGTGLGMSTAYGIVKQHGGSIWAYSEAGHGTTIRIYLPVSGKTLDPPTPSRQHTALLGDETILLAEDDRQVRNLSSTALQRYGYNVLIAENGREALAKVASHEPKVDLLLTDVIMPDINGKQLFQNIADNHPDIRVIYMSGYTDDVIAHHGVIDEGVDFIEKPFNIEALAAKVREVLDK